MNIEKNLAALKNLKKPKAVIFDWDNTLVDTWPLIHRAINDTMLAMNQEEWSLKKVKDTIHKSMRESFPQIFGDDWQKAGEVYKSSYRSTHLDELTLLPDALKLINKLQEKNILQMIISNKIGITLRKETKKLNITDKFFSVIGSMDSSFDKPHRAPFDLALSGSGLDPQQDHIWFIGDSLADVECAYNTNCQPIIFGYDDAISKTISLELSSAGKNNEGPIPLYFKHEDLINVIDKF